GFPGGREHRSALECLRFAPLLVQLPQPSRASAKAPRSRVTSRCLLQLSEIPSARYARQMATPFERSRAFEGKRCSACEQSQSTVLRRVLLPANRHKSLGRLRDGQEKFRSEPLFQSLAVYRESRE